MKASSRALNAATIVLAVAAVVAVARALHVDGRTARRHSFVEVPEAERYAVGSSRIGDSASALVITVFSDYGCRYCGMAWDSLKQVRREAGHRLGIVFRHFPLFDGSSEASVASICAARQGRFELMHEVLFSVADSLSARRWDALAQRAGVSDIVGFNRCVADSSDAWAELNADREAGRTLGVNVLPTMIVGTTRINGLVEARVLDGVVAASIRSR